MINSCNILRFCLIFKFLLYLRFTMGFLKGGGDCARAEAKSVPYSHMGNLKRGSFTEVIKV